MLKKDDKNKRSNYYKIKQYSKDNIFCQQHFDEPRENKKIMWII